MMHLRRTFYKTSSLGATASIRGLFWSSSSAPATPILIEKEEEMKIMQYRGRIDDFNQNAKKFELYLRGKEAPESTIDQGPLIEGKCTVEGTLLYKERAVAKKGIPAKNFRKPFPLPFAGGRYDLLCMSTVGLGTYMGKPDDEDDPNNDGVYKAYWSNVRLGPFKATSKSICFAGIDKNYSEHF